MPGAAGKKGRNIYMKKLLAGMLSLIMMLTLPLAAPAEDAPAEQRRDVDREFCVL